MTGDGKQDIVGIGNFAQELFIALGNGDGSFQRPIFFNVGQNIQSVAVGDLNGDGKPDVVLGIGGGIAVFMNNGTSSILDAPTYYSFASGQDLADGEVVIGKFNNKGLPDVAVADNTGQAIEVFPNLGNGTLGTPMQYLNTIVKGSDYLLAGDFNNDGNLDLVVSYQNSSNVGLLLGNGDGTFQQEKVIDTGSPDPGGPLAAADFDGDGNLDLAYAGQYSLMVLPGNGHGGFGTPIQVQQCYDSSGLVAANFNGDGKPDLAVTDDLEPGSYGIAFNTSSHNSVASFKVATSSPITSGQSFTVTVTAQSSTGATVTGYTGTVDFSSSDGQQVVPASGQFKASDNGVAQFTLTLKTAGSQTLQVQDSANASATGSTNVTVNPGPLDGTKTTVGFASSTDQSGTADVITFVVRDVGGNPISGLKSSAFVFSSLSGTSTGTLGTVTQTNTPGTYVATFTGVLAGTTRTLLLKVNGIAITTNPTVQVTPGAVSATKTTVQFATSIVKPGQTDLVTVVVRDAAGNAIVGLPNVDFSFDLSGGTSTGTFGTVLPKKTSGDYALFFTGHTAGTACLVTVGVDGVQLTKQPKVMVS